MSDKLSNVIRKQVFKRDGNKCQKCHKTKSLQVHHIYARQDGGADDLDNLTTLCLVCHAEWHMIEAGTRMDYEKWLMLPSAIHLLVAYMQHWGSDVTAADLKQGISMTWELVKATA